MSEGIHHAHVKREKISTILGQIHNILRAIHGGLKPKIIFYVKMIIFFQVVTLFSILVFMKLVNENLEIIKSCSAIEVEYE